MTSAAASPRGLEAAPLSSELTRAVRINLLVSGHVAWLLTVAAPAVTTNASLLARFAAGVALLALWLGVLGSLRFPRFGVGMAMWGFIGACAVTWLLLGEILGPAQLPGVRAGLGAIAWLTFSLAWGSIRQRDAVPENDPRVISAEPLEARSRVSKLTYVTFAVSALAALAPWLLAWRATENGHALLAHAVALAIVMWMLSAGAETAVALGTRRRLLPPGVRVQLASGALGMITLLGIIGILYWQLRGAR
jgi:hypothetical protein